MMMTMVMDDDDSIYDDDDEYDEDDIEVTFMKIINYGSSYINKQWLRGFE